jgi:hypothetical protein
VRVYRHRDFQLLILRGFVNPQMALAEVVYRIRESASNLISVRARLVKFNYCDGKTPPKMKPKKCTKRSPELRCRMSSTERVVPPPDIEGTRCEAVKHNPLQGVLAGYRIPRSARDCLVCSGFDSISDLKIASTHDSMGP